LHYPFHKTKTGSGRMTTFDDERLLPLFFLSQKKNYYFRANCFGCDQTIERIVSAVQALCPNRPGNVWRAHPPHHPLLYNKSFPRLAPLSLLPSHSHSLLHSHYPSIPYPKRRKKFRVTAKTAE